MDDVARAFYEIKFELAFEKNKADEFQNFFSSIMEKRYPADFGRVRPWGNVGDRKNDGYLRSQRILFQVYAPNEIDSATCVAKIREDFAGAFPYWREHFDSWVFVHNSRAGLGPDVTKILLELGATHPVSLTQWGFEELRQQVMALKEGELASLLGPAPTRLGMVSLGLEDLAPVLDHIVRLPPASEPDLRPVPADKIQQNMLSPSVEVLLKAGMSRADLVRKYFHLKPMLQDQIAESFRDEYARLRASLDPDSIFMELQRFAGGNVVRTPSTQSAVLAVLAFFFEECDIFERSVEVGP
ncbi:MAG: hypothetical protein MUF64_28685 [Polyangiaceae bacterium]|jgi:hypothetical protein|nr:hypothetical protein [Polyangiaceae bacterium]